jgi:hypothetical protein
MADKQIVVFPRLPDRCHTMTQEMRLVDKQLDDPRHLEYQFPNGRNFYNIPTPTGYDD